MSYTLKSGSENKYLEEKYVTWDELGWIGPSQSPSVNPIYPATLWMWILIQTVNQITM